MTDGPLIVQSDKTLLLEVDHPLAQECRQAIAPFAELERSPEHVHTYRLTPLGLWNARAAGHDAEQVVDALVRFSRYAVPHALLVDVADTMDRYGRLQLVKHPTHGLVLVSLDRAVLEEILRQKKIAPMLGERVEDDIVLVHPSERGRLKQALLKVGWPAEDLAGYVDGEVHLLPAPIFRLTADLQSRRRLGRTATLIREDGREGDVFSLIGPKRYDAPWKDIENQGWIAPADCTEVRVTLTDAERMTYATAEAEDRYRLAATARTKLPVVKAIVDRHPDDQIRVIGAC